MALWRHSEERTVTESDDPVDRFIAQPASHFAEDEDRPVEHGARARPSSWWSRFTHFLFEKEPSPYSSIAPRTMDGRRTRIFFFTGNGKGR